MIASWVKFWATVANIFSMSYNASLVGRIKSDSWVAESLAEVDLPKLQAELKSLGLYIE
jgi:hypothetical protein